MAGKKGRSGPPKNLNAAKSGVTTWLRRRALPRQKQHVAKMVEIYRDGLTVCKGGPGVVTEVEAALIENAARAYGACLLILEEAASRGLVRTTDDSWDLMPGLTRLQGFLSVEQRALSMIGLTRRAKDAGSLEALLHDAATDAEPGEENHEARSE